MNKIRSAMIFTHQVMLY